MEHDSWRIHEYVKRLPPTLEAVVRRNDQCTFETMDAAQFSGVHQRLADDEALFRRGLDLAAN